MHVTLYIKICIYRCKSSSFGWQRGYFMLINYYWITSIIIYTGWGNKYLLKISQRWEGENQSGAVLWVLFFVCQASVGKWDGDGKFPQSQLAGEHFLYALKAWGHSRGIKTAGSHTTKLHDLAFHWPEVTGPDDLSNSLEGSASVITEVAWFGIQHVLRSGPFW